MSRWRIGRLSARAVPVDEALRMLTLYGTRYTGWTVRHFHERWQAEHGGTVPIAGPRRHSRPRGRSRGHLDAARSASSGRANPCPA